MTRFHVISATVQTTGDSALRCTNDVPTCMPPHLVSLFTLPLFHLTKADRPQSETEGELGECPEITRVDLFGGKSKREPYSGWGGQQPLACNPT